MSLKVFHIALHRSGHLSSPWSGISTVCPQRISGMSSYDQYTPVDDLDLKPGEFTPAPLNPPPPSEPPPKAKLLPLLQPIGLLLLGASIALGHHLFNDNMDGELVDPNSNSVRSQVWTSRFGTAFAFGFRAALSSCLGFVLCQLMWLTLRTKFLTFPEIDTAYLTANRDVVATFLSASILKSPLLVAVVSVTLLLPVPTIFTPSSLQVASRPFEQTSTHCVVPSGNITNGGTGGLLYQSGGWGYWTGYTPVAVKLATSTFMGQKIPSLPQTCGLNCSYTISLPSFAFRCQSGVQLPAGMSRTVNNESTGEETFWNATTNSTDDHPSAAFYVFWKSTPPSNTNDTNGTSGTALCTVGTAMYDFTVVFRNGQQTTNYTVKPTGELLDATTSAGISLATDEYDTVLQLSSLAAAARSLLLGSLAVLNGASAIVPEMKSPVVSAAFFDSTLTSGKSFIWADVPRGIEEFSHNVSAAILTMNLGTKETTCSMSKVNIVYAYDHLNLWLPYGATLFVVLLCLILGVMMFFKFNLENLTPSFSDTVSITRNSSLANGDDHHSAKHKHKSDLPKFRLGELSNGDKGFGMPEELKEEDSTF